MATRGYQQVLGSATPVTNASSSVWVDQCTATFNLDASSTYLILGYTEGQVNNTTAADGQYRLFDGTTALCTSNFRHVSSDASEWTPANLVALITTTSAATPTLAIQAKLSGTAASRLVSTRNGVIFALKLGANDASFSNDVAGTSSSNPGTWTDYNPASGTKVLTFTPGTTGDYLIFASATQTYSSAADGSIVALLCEDGTTRAMTSYWVPINSGNKQSYACTVRRTGLTAVAQSFKLQHSRQRSATGTSTLDQVRMVAFRLADFDSSSHTEDLTSRTTTSSTYVDLGTTQTDTPTNALDYLLLGSWWEGTNNNAILHSSRLTDGTNVYNESQRKENYHAAEPNWGQAIVVPRKFTGAGSSLTHKIQGKITSVLTLTSPEHRLHLLQLQAAGGGGSVTGSGSTAGTSSTSATAKTAHNASASTAGVATATATAKTAHAASATTAGTSSTSCSATVAHRATATTAGVATTAATGTVAHHATASTAGSSTTSATAKAAHVASASTTGSSTTSATGRTAHVATGSTAGSSSTSATGSVARKKTELLVDRFDSAINAPPWNYSNLVTVVGGRARFEVRSDYSSTMNTGSTVYSLLDSHLFAQAFPDTGNTTRQLILQALDGNSASAIQIAKSGTSLVLENTGLNAHADYVTFNATSMAWWQLRADTTNVYWETSPDGSTWTTQRTTSFATLGWTPAEVKPAVTVGYWGTETTPFTVEIDNVNHVVTAHQATGSTSGTASTAATAVVAHKASGATAGSSTTAATARTAHAASAAAAGSSTTSATATTAHHATASTAGTSTTTAAGTVVRAGVVSGTTNGSSSTACTATVAHRGAGSAAGSSSTFCTAKVNHHGVATIGGSSTAQASGVVAHRASGTSSGSSTTSLNARVLRLGAGSTSGSSTATAVGKLTKYGVALTTGTSTTTAAALVEAHPQVALGPILVQVLDNGVAASLVANEVVAQALDNGVRASVLANDMVCQVVQTELEVAT